MYFKKLELVGFKSFLNKTTLHFEPGITAVVGPNGTGKSNVFDAIRWVLGEQSVKSLRGSKMEDVIFNGTDTKEPLGLAEVSLTLSNEGRVFPIDEDEFTITRRIFRSGESEYQLNKTTVRLKDINELFMGTGVGAEAYSLVEQGKIDLILSSRPEDRRMVFDEASGITKYKAHKRETLRKLQETEQNLLRINDIVAEVKRQIASLERQANKAKRYKQVFEELKSKEVIFAQAQIDSILKEKLRILNGIKEMEEAQEGNYSLMNEIELRIKEENQDIKSLEDKTMELKTQILNIDNLIARNSQHAKLDSERIQELEKAKISLSQQLKHAQKRAQENGQKLGNFKIEFGSIKEARAEKENLLQLKEKEQKEILDSIRLSNEQINQAKKAIMELVNKQSSVKNDILDLTARIQSYLARERRLDIELVKTLEEKAAVDESMNEASRQLNELEAEFKQCDFALRQAKKQGEDERASLQALKSEIQELGKDKAKYLSQKDFLDKLKLAYEEECATMNALVLIEGEPAGELSGMVIKVKDARSATSKDKEVFEGASYRLSAEAKPIPLTTEGIERRIAQISEQLDRQTELSASKEKSIQQLNARISQLESRSRELEISFNGKKAQHNNISQQLARLNEEKEIIETESAQTKAEMADLNKQQEEADGKLSALQAQGAAKEELIQNEQSRISGLNLTREKNLVLITQTKTELSNIEKRLNSEQETLRLLEDTYRQDNERLEEIGVQIKESEEKAQMLSMEIEGLGSANQKALVNKNSLQESLKELKTHNEKILLNLQDDQGQLEGKRKIVEETKNRLYNLQMRQQESEFNERSIKDRLRQAYKVDLDTAVECGSSGWQASADSISGEIQALKDKLDSYGTVNLVAIEEYDELKTRYDFLNQQQNDLLSAKERLHEAIVKINRTTKKMFTETFEKIAAHFRDYFRLLFGGGDASLFLIDEQDPLESGIEIVCRPPGKKLQNVLLLSGGEKTLSAIALIFAIFKVKPSPFCVLDEVDAALDEANVDRYGRLLQEFARQSQFIVITHNKKTIVNADVMYGITMEEAGISKIVSVKFSKEKAGEKEETGVLVS